MFDAIVIGSGMSGGIAAKELCERGLKTLVIERGRKLVHGASYTDWMQPWDQPNAGMIPEEELARDYAVQRQCYAVNSTTQQYWVKDSEHPYTTPEGRPFAWIRGYHLGGRSIMWGRQTYRWRDLDFEANARDGHRRRLADPLRGHRALVRPRREVHRRRRARRKVCRSCRMASSCRRSD